MKKFLIVLAILLCVGCKNETKKVSVEMNCDDVITTVEVKEGNKLSCKLLDTNYDFTVKKITDDKIELEVSDYGLNNGPGIIQKVKNFTIEKDEELRLHTETTDYQEVVTFKRK